MILRFIGGLSSFFAFLFLSACASKAVVVKNIGTEERKVSFPTVGDVVGVRPNELMFMNASYISKHVYRLNQDSVSIKRGSGSGFGRINVSGSDDLIESSLEGKRVFCTERDVYRDPLGGMSAVPACFIEAAPGIFNSFMAAPGMVWFTMQLTENVSFKRMEVVTSKPSRFAKRELFLDEIVSGRIFMTEKEYELNLSQPSRVKPLVVPLAIFPFRISIDGARIDVIGYEDGVLRVKLVSVDN